MNWLELSAIVPYRRIHRRCGRLRAARDDDSGQHQAVNDVTAQGAGTKPNPWQPV